MFWTALLLLLGGCDTTSTTSSPKCEVRIQNTSPSESHAGETVVATGGPFTDRIDTALFLGGERSSVTGVSRDGCDSCDTCREDHGCEDCGECPACGPVCDADCTESVTFVVPDVSAGPQELVLFNVHGSSNALSFTVLETPSSDTGADTGPDSGADTGPDTDDDSGQDSGTDSDSAG